MSPIETENKIITFENKLIQKFASHQYAVLITGIILLIFLYFTLPLWTQSEYPKWSKFFIAQDRTWALIILIVGSFFVYFVKPKYQTYLSLAFITSSWVIPLNILGSFRWEILAPIIFILGNYFFLKKFRKYHLVSLAFVAVLFLCLILFLGFDANKNHDGKVFQYFSVLHIEVILFFFINSIFSKSTHDQLSFNPLQLFAPLPIPDESYIINNKTEKKTNFIKGALYIIEAQFIFMALIALFRFEPFKESPSVPIQFYLFILFISASLKVCSGLLWMYGIQSPPTSYFLLLAKSPLETWQRGSLFFAKFIFSKIYLPLWIRTRNNLISTLASIMFVALNLFILHEFILGNLLSFLFPNLKFMVSTWFSLKQQTLWLGLWILWIFLFEHTFKKINFLSKTSIGNWILLLLTHLGNMSIIPVMLFLSDIL